MADTQETRSARVTAAVTPTELRQIKAVALLRDTDISNLLRGLSIEAVVSEYMRARGEENVA